MDIELIPALKDNYIYLLRDRASGAIGVVDPAEAGLVLAALNRSGSTLSHVFNTHHHTDHIGGNKELKRKFGCQIIGARADRSRIPALDLAVGDGETCRLGSQTVVVIDTPGHTRGHIAYYFPKAEALFCGDTLFALGCGRLFEGTAEELWGSLLKLRALPPATRVYCGHEYTLSNARFALAIDPDNPALQRRAAAVQDLRDRGLPTIPSTIGEEIETNPFLRADQPTLRAALAMTDADPVEVFAEIRRRKDHF